MVFKPEGIKLNNIIAGKPRILYYDLETTPLLAYVWGCGDQYVRHNQLHKDSRMWGIICVTYCFNDGKPAKHIDWGYEEQDTSKIIKEFDAIIGSADHIIGKNNKRFDDKMLNALRMLNSETAMPRWAQGNDDLEQQMRRHFRLPSQSLDYISESLGLGGKIKMEFQDWIDIVEKNKNGVKSFNKMIKYGKKDVEDTRTIWNKLEEYIEPKFKVNTFYGTKRACIRCGSDDIRLNGTQFSGGIKYQNFKCGKCMKYAGKCIFGSNKAGLK